MGKGLERNLLLLAELMSPQPAPGSMGEIGTRIGLGKSCPDLSNLLWGLR